MPYLFLIGLIAAICYPLPAPASEDADPFMFGGTANFEIEEGDGAYGENPDFADLPPLEPLPADFTPPPSDYVPIPQQPDVPMLQKPGAPAQKETEKPQDSVSITTSVDKNQPLTENLKNDTAASDGTLLPLPKVEGTWVDKLSTANPLSLLGSGDNSPQDTGADSARGSEPGPSLEGLVDKARISSGGRSNASVFDISGIMLRMTLRQVDETAQNRGFRKIYEKLQVPNFIKWRNEEYCRNRGVVGYERLDACVNEKAKKDKQQYVQVTKYAKYDTKEELEVTFTSNFTYNKVYKITYKTMAASITGNSPKAVYIRNIKVYDFWKKINQKYGKPDNKEAVTWGLGGNNPYLKAKTGWLLLEDPMFRELDYTRMSREDQRYMNTDLYSF